MPALRQELRSAVWRQLAAALEMPQVSYSQPSVAALLDLMAPLGSPTVRLNSLSWCKGMGMELDVCDRGSLWDLHQGSRESVSWIATLWLDSSLRTLCVKIALGLQD